MKNSRKAHRSAMSTLPVGRGNRQRHARARLRIMFVAITSRGGTDCDDPCRRNNGTSVQPQSERDKTVTDNGDGPSDEGSMRTDFERSFRGRLWKLAEPASRLLHGEEIILEDNLVCRTSKKAFKIT